MYSWYNVRRSGWMENLVIWFKIECLNIFCKYCEKICFSCLRSQNICNTLDLSYTSIFSETSVCEWELPVFWTLHNPLGFIILVTHATYVDKFSGTTISRFNTDGKSYCLQTESHLLPRNNIYFADCRLRCQKIGYRG